MNRVTTALIYGLSAVVGLAAFTYPLLLPGLRTLAVDAAADRTAFRLADGPLLTLILVALCLSVLLLEVQGQVTSAKIAAALGLLVAMGTVLRFLETALPGPGGFSPVFVPIILAGYVFGARFGFLAGSLTLLASALLTGGVGPWLPFQMFAAGWVGLTAGWLPHARRARIELVILATFAFAWGLLFGAALNLYFWPFITGDARTSWQPGSSVGETMLHYGAFYVTTSLGWDLLRAAGNAALMVAVGLPASRALARFRDRFRFQWT